MCKKGIREATNGKNEIKKKYPAFFLMKINEITKRSKKEYIKIKQKIEYGSNNVFPNLTIAVWSIDRCTGNIINLIKCTNTCGENQKIRSIVVETCHGMSLTRGDDKEYKMKVIAIINR